MRVMSWLLVTALAFVCIYIEPWALLRHAEASALTKADIEQLHEFFDNYSQNGTAFTYDQLVAWFESQQDKTVIFEKFPRLFAFCVTSNQIKNSSRTKEDSHIKKFERIMEFVESAAERFYSFNKSKHLTGNGNWIKNVTVSRINTPDVDMVNLRQWVHLKVEVAEGLKLKGLYMQSIVGPLGLPFGEFTSEFPCQDDINGTQDIETVGQLAPCTFRPKCTIIHPSVYVGYDDAGRDVFHTNYFWTDITCMEMPYVQFLLIAVKDFDEEPKSGVTHQALMSPVFLNPKFDTKSGAPYPYYPEWRDKMYCFQNATSMESLYKILYPWSRSKYPNTYPSEHINADSKFAEISWNVSDKIFRIQPNEVYDACTTSDITKPYEGRDSLRLECPPGAFRCNSSYGQVKDIGQLRNELVENEEKVSNCIPCGAPPCEVSGFSEEACHNRVALIPNKVVNASTHVETGEQIGKGKAHGITAMLAFLVLVPLSNFVARFYKEVCGEFLCGNGPWIFFHVLSQVISLMIMWLAIGPVSPKLLDYKDAVAQCAGAYGNATTEQAQACIQNLSFANPHVPLAILAFLMQHFLVGFGFLRVANNKIRNIQVILHSHFGHACWLIGAVSALLAAFGELHNCLDSKFIVIMLFVTPLMFYAGGVALDCVNDKKIGVIPRRKQWPVLEAIKLEGTGPCTMPKCILFGVFFGIMMIIWVIALASYFSFSMGELKFKNSTSAEKNGSEVFELGLIFSCEIETEFGK